MYGHVVGDLGLCWDIVRRGGGVFGSGRGGGFVKTGFEGRVEYLVEHGRLVLR